jgi:Tfp pilus assembly protein PilF
MCFRFLAISILALLCVPAHADSAPAWVQVTTPHFTVVTDAGEKQARHIAGQFERMQAVFQKLIPSARSDSGAPIVVLAVKNRRDFQTLEPAEYLAKGSLNLAGLFLQANERCYILVRLDAEGEHPYSTVYHEYTHYITRRGNLPLWLNEGIAEFYQNTDIDAHEVRLGQPSNDDIQFLRTQSLLPLPTLFAVDHGSPYYHDEQKGSIFYSESWALTDLLMINDFRNKTSLLPNYIKALAAGQTSITAAVTAFGDLKRLQDALDTHVSHGDYAFLRLPITIPIDEAAFPLVALTPPDADAYRADVLVSDGRTDDAQKLLDSILASDPNNALAHESEAMLYLRKGQFDAARKEYAQAVALHSTSYLAYYYAATLSLRSGDHTDPAIEADLQRCLKLNPNFAPANDALAAYYALTHQNLDTAVTLSLAAISVDPDNFNYRLNNANLHMQRKEIPSALAVLESARPLAHNPSEVAELDARIAQIHDYQDRLDHPVAASIPSGESTVTNVSFTSTSNGNAVVPVTTATDDPHYPDGPPAGPQRLAKGVLHNVQCAYPTVLSLTVDGGAKPIALYTNNMYKITYAADGFQPKDPLDPCKLDGAKAMVTYTDVKDPRVAGQIVSIVVTK